MSDIPPYVHPGTPLHRPSFHHVEQVHETTEEVETIELSPPHLPRTETPIYRRAHEFLIHTKKAPCVVCGVTIDTLSDPSVNKIGSTQMETHHYPIERSLVDACDPAKVHRDFPQVFDRESLLTFVDSPANLLVVCDLCHRSPRRGIHHLLTQDWIIQKYLLDGYIIAASPADAAQAVATDSMLVQQKETPNDAPANP